MSLLEKTVTFFRRWLGLGWKLALYEAFNHFYDVPLYGWAQHHFGLVLGTALMTLGSLLQCGVMFWRYDENGSDWMFVQLVEELQTSENKNWYYRLLSSLARLKKGKFSFIAFVLAGDPLIVAVHYRKSRHDWLTLAYAVAIANLGWATGMGIVVKIGEWLVHIIAPHFS